uniref:ATP synthase gamma chain n=1 Tax=Lygus hesperus TaxID=30085 RepID=A0A0A9Z362_LYGHE
MLARFLLLAVISIGIIEKCAVLSYYARDTLKSPDYEELDHPLTEEKEYKEEEPRSVIHYKRTRVKRSDHSTYFRPPVSHQLAPAPAPANQKYGADDESEESNPKLAFAENHRSPVSF